jgi:hypothetical protein
VTIAPITGADANAGETEYPAAQLSGGGIKVLRAPGPEITVDDGQVRILVPARPDRFSGQNCWSERRIGDLNPGGCCHPTALAVRRHRPD